MASVQGHGSVCTRQPRRGDGRSGNAVCDDRTVRLGPGKDGSGVHPQPQQDPPAAIFQNHASMPTAALRPFARRPAVALAYVKEMDTLATKRLELSAPKQKATPPGPKAAETAKEGETLTRKQLRAKKWAEQRAKAPAA